MCLTVMIDRYFWLPFLSLELITWSRMLCSSVFALLVVRLKDPWLFQQLERQGIRILSWKPGTSLNFCQEVFLHLRYRRCAFYFSMLFVIWIFFCKWKYVCCTTQIFIWEVIISFIWCFIFLFTQNSDVIGHKDTEWWNAVRHHKDWQLSP